MNLIHPGPEEGMLCSRAVRAALTRPDGAPPAARFIKAVERGSRVNADLSGNWDYWPLAEARAGLNID